MPGGEQTGGAGRAVLSNNNRGVWFIEERTEEIGPAPPKREFSARESNKTTINPALTETPRTWPASLKKSTITGDGSTLVIERSQNGEKDRKFEGTTVQSTTFSTSRVHMSMSTTPRPALPPPPPRPALPPPPPRSPPTLQEASEASLASLMATKGEKLLAALGSNAVDQPALHLPANRKFGQRRRGRPRRKKFRPQSAKSLPPGEEAGDPYVVFPMDRQLVENKKIEEILGPQNHPGLKRISAYEFEKEMFGIGKDEQKLSKPVAELKDSIDDLANTMTKLSKHVMETTTKKSENPGDDRIRQLQAEIAKLTRTLESMKISPAEDQKVSSSVTDQVDLNQIARPEASDSAIEDLGTDIHKSESTIVEKTWTAQGNWNLYKNSDLSKKQPEVQPEPEKLEIIEVYTVPTTVHDTNPKQRTVFRARDPTVTTERSQQSAKQMVQREQMIAEEITTRRHPTEQKEISAFFGSPSEDRVFDQSPDITTFFQPQTIRNQVSEESQSGVLGLFEMMGKINKETSQNFDVVRIPTQVENKVDQSKRFQQMEEKLRLEKQKRIEAEEEQLRNQQREKLKLFQMFQQEDLKRKQLEATKKTQGKDDKLKTFDSLHGWTDDESWKETVGKTAKPQSDPAGLATASITIEKVKVSDARDYDVSSGIVRLKKEPKSASVESKGSFSIIDGQDYLLLMH